jgi:hypothetical protein
LTEPATHALRVDGRLVADGLGFEDRKPEWFPRLGRRQRVARLRLHRGKGHRRRPRHERGRPGHHAAVGAQCRFEAANRPAGAQGGGHDLQPADGHGGDELDGETGDDDGVAGHGALNGAG